MLSPAQYWAVLIVVTLYAFARGRYDERFAAAVCVTATVATRLVMSPLTVRYSSIEFGILTVDVAALAGFTYIALRSNRFWPLWTAAFQLTSILSHFMKLVEVDLMREVYAAAERLWVYPIFLTIVVGTWRSHRRRQELLQA